MKSEVQTRPYSYPPQLGTAAERQDGVKRAVLGWGAVVGRGGLTITQKYACMHGQPETVRDGSGNGNETRAWARARAQAVGNERTKEGRRPGREAEGASRILVTGYWWLVAGYWWLGPDGAEAITSGVVKHTHTHGSKSGPTPCGVRGGVEH